MEVRPLNKELYDWLSRTLGSVKISKAGTPMIRPHEVALASPDGTDRSQVQFDETGEYYVCTCPCCGHKDKLYINHMWQMPVDVVKRDGTVETVKLDHVATCYYCHAEKETEVVKVQRFVKGHRVTENVRMNKIMLALKRYTDLIESGKMPPIRHVEDAKPVFVPLPPMIPLQDLPYMHPACSYLRERGVDPAYLGEVYKCGFVEEYVEPIDDNDITGKSHRAAYHKIVIPVYRKGALAFWQARAIDDTSHPKYYIRPGPKAFPFHNWDTASQFKGVILVEGFFDEVSAGPSGLCLFGKDINFGRVVDIVSQWDYIVIALDPTETLLQVKEPNGNVRTGSAHVLMERIIAAQRGSGKAPVMVTYPNLDCDPGSLGPKGFWEVLEGSIPSEYVDAVRTPVSGPIGIQAR